MKKSELNWAILQVTESIQRRKRRYLDKKSRDSERQSEAEETERLKAESAGTSDKTVKSLLSLFYNVSNEATDSFLRTFVTMSALADGVYRANTALKNTLHMPESSISQSDVITLMEPVLRLEFLKQILSHTSLDQKALLEKAADKYGAITTAQPVKKGKDLTKDAILESLLPYVRGLPPDVPIKKKNSQYP